MQMIKPEDRTPYVKLIVEKYHDTAYPPDGSEAPYELSLIHISEPTRP